MTHKPFHEALRELMEERELTNRRLAKISQDRHPAPAGEWSRLHSVRQNRHDERMAGTPGLAHTVISMLVRGDAAPSSRAMEIIADALQVPPEHFAEYRLDVARERLEWRAPDLETRVRLLALALQELGSRGASSR